MLLEQAGPPCLLTGRARVWERYHEAFAETEASDHVRCPVVPAHCEHNAHMYYLLVPDIESRTAVINALKAVGIQSVFHYVLLHSAPAGRKYGRVSGNPQQTDHLSDRLVRLPMWNDLGSDQDKVIEAAVAAARSARE